MAFKTKYYLSLFKPFIASQIPRNAQFIFSWFLTLILAFTMINVFGQSNAQIKSTPDFEQGYWIFGLNGGWSYQSSDIKAQYNGFGFGATLGKNLYYQPGAPFLFDLRGRLLLARQYGLDNQRSFDISNNNVLNGTSGLNYLDYPSEFNEAQGFVFQNNQTTLGELGLEGVLTLNRLRENTGVVASLYGGIGLDWYRTKTDQAGANGQPYYQGYSNIDVNDSKSAIRDELKSAILDGDYESLADEFGSEGKIGFMPSLGVELGYEFTPRFSMHLGHRVTFSGTNLLDGHQWADDQNDLYHYTNLAMRWKLNGRSRKAIAGPKIDILQPYETSIISNNPREEIRARVTGVNGPTDIVCRINGRPVSFDFRDGIVSVTPPLESGQNDFDITAKNSAGRDSKSLRIFLEGDIITPPPPPPSTGTSRPNVVLTNPPRNNYTTNSKSFQVKATIDGVSNKSNVLFYLNGREIRDFRFYGNTGSFQSTISLQSGSNDIEIRAKNSAGSDVAEAKIYYEERQSQNRPTVDITNPQRSQVETDRASASIEATIQNVSSKSDIRFTVNGRTNNNFSFNSSRGQFRADISLIEGRNQIEVRAQNTQGEANDRVDITYRRVQQPKQPPMVQITRPDRNTTSTTKSEATIEANIDHVSSKNDVQFYLNGRRVYDFNFSTYNGRLSHNIRLQEGENDVVIRASNTDGQDEASLTIRRIGDVTLDLPPTVRITQPGNNSTTDEQNIKLKAELKLVKRKSDITLLVNGRTINDFSFNTSTKILNASLRLTQGSNNIEVKGKNNAGQASDKVRVTFSAPTPKPPVVQINSPANNSSSDNATINLRATLREVSSKQDITLTVKGRRITDFQFNPSNDRLDAKIRLSEGQNQIKVEGRNADGKDEASITVTYRQATPPVISWESPRANTTVKENRVSIRALVKNVANKSGIQLSLNGNKTTTFSYTNGTLTAKLSSLKKGENIIEVIAKNQDGQDSEKVKINYQPATTLPKPVVTFLKPAKPGSTINESRMTISASVENVSGKEDVTLLVNGKNITSFNYNTKTKRIETKVSLKSGKNSIVITAKNKSGTGKATTNVVYKVPRLVVPEVTFESVSQPTINPLNPQTGRSTVIATIKNVTGKDQITFKVNGEATSNFSYDVKTMRLQATINLVRGVNNITIKAENRDGADEKSYELTF